MLRIIRTTSKDIKSLTYYRRQTLAVSTNAPLMSLFLGQSPYYMVDCNNMIKQVDQLCYGSIEVKNRVF